MRRRSYGYVIRAPHPGNPFREKRIPRRFYTVSAGPIEGTDMNRCAECGDPYRPRVSWQKYCTGTCRGTALTRAYRARLKAREAP